MGEEVPLPAQRRAYGWALRVTGWIMRTAGTVAGIIGLQGTRTSYTATHQFGYTGPNWLERSLIFIAIMVAGIVVFGLSLRVGRYARRHLVHVIESPASLAPGSYVLYLRPFFQDESTSGIAPQPEGGNSFNMVMRSGRTYEERLARVFREFGPLVTVGRPEEKLPRGSGARRIYIPLHGWEPVVGELIGNARLIILGAGPGKGTVWEYVEVMRRRDPSRLIVLVTDRGGYERFKASSIAEAEGVLMELQSQYGSSWQAPILPDLPSPARPKFPTAFYFLAMLYFSAGWEPHLAFFDRSAARGGQRKVNKYFKKTLAPVMAHVRTGTRVTTPEKADALPVRDLAGAELPAAVGPDELIAVAAGERDRGAGQEREVRDGTRAVRGHLHP
jgi:hypothetical protein